MKNMSIDKNIKKFKSEALDMYKIISILIFWKDDIIKMIIFAIFNNNFYNYIP
jgi:hypothetical protein